MRVGRPSDGASSWRGWASSYRAGALAQTNDVASSTPPTAPKARATNQNPLLPCKDGDRRKRDGDLGGGDRPAQDPVTGHVGPGRGFFLVGLLLELLLGLPILRHLLVVVDLRLPGEGREQFELGLDQRGLDALGLEEGPIVVRSHLLEHGLVGVVAAQHGRHRRDDGDDGRAQGDLRHPACDAPTSVLEGLLLEGLVKVFGRGLDLFGHGRFVRKGVGGARRGAPTDPCRVGS